MTETNKAELRVWIVGEHSGDPSEWSEYFLTRTLVIAGSEEEALELARPQYGRAIPLDLSRPQLVLRDSAVHAD